MSRRRKGAARDRRTMALLYGTGILNVLYYINTLFWIGSVVAPMALAIAYKQSDALWLTPVALALCWGFGATFKYLVPVAAKRRLRGLPFFVENLEEYFVELGGRRTHTEARIIAKFQQNVSVAQREAIEAMLRSTGTPIALCLRDTVELRSECLTTGFLVGAYLADGHIRPARMTYLNAPVHRYVIQACDKELAALHEIHPIASVRLEVLPGRK